MMDTTFKRLGQDDISAVGAALQGRVQGVVAAPGSSRYDALRVAWNLTVDQRPALIVAVKDAQDVSEAVRFAAERRLGVAVQTTGHGVIRPANGALLILTSALDEVVIDPEAGTARIGGGATWARVLEMGAQYGLAPLLGSSPGVGVVGYTLGGGMGWLVRKYGLAVDSVISLQVVTADGQIRRASAEENADLFWGLRGSKGSLGVVTEVELRLAPVAQVYGGNLFYPAEMAREVFARYRQWIESLPEEMSSSIVVMNFPPVPQIPEPLRGQSFVIVRGCFAGPLEQGKALVDEWRSWRAPAMDLWGEMPFSQVATISSDPEDPMPAWMSGTWLRELNDEAAEILLRHTLPAGGPPALVFSEVRHVGGAMARVDPHANAFGRRDAGLIVESVGAAPTPEAQQHLMAHIAQLKAELGPYLTGSDYANFLEGEEAAANTRRVYLPESFERLQELKGRYDPGNVFRFGFEI